MIVKNIYDKSIILLLRTTFASYVIHVQLIFNEINSRTNYTLRCLWSNLRVRYQRRPLLAQNFRFLGFLKYPFNMWRGGWVCKKLAKRLVLSLRCWLSSSESNRTIRSSKFFLMIAIMAFRRSWIELKRKKTYFLEKALKTKLFLSTFEKLILEERSQKKLSSGGIHWVITVRNGMGKADFIEWIKADFWEWSKADSTFSMLGS